MLRRLRSRRRLTASAVVVALGSAAGLPAAAAAAEPTTQALPGRTMAAVVVDLDHDGSAELARLVHRDGDTSLLEVWRLADATWELHGSEAIPLAESGDEVGDPMGTAALLSVDVEGEPVLILHTAIIDNASTFGSSCCAAAHLVQLDRDGLELVSIDPPAAGADVIQAIDMDADGTDEVVAVHTTYAPDTLEPQATTTVSIRRRVGGEWILAFEQTRSDPNGVSVTPAESDGRPGLDLLVATPEAFRLERITLSGGSFREELGAMPRSSADGAWIAGAVAGNLLVSESTGLSAVRWEAGGVPVLVDRLPPEDGALLAAIGDGPDGIVLVGTGQNMFGAPASLEIRDGGLALLGHVEASPEARALSELLDALSRSNGVSINQTIWPFFGHIPGGWSDGRPAFAVGGRLVRIGGPDGFTSQPMATLTSTLVGLFGPGLEWAALCDGCYGGSDVAYPTMGEPWGRAVLTLVPTADIDAPEALVAPEADYIGAYPLENGRSGASTELRARGDGFEIVLRVPPGSSAVSFDGRSLVDHGAVDAPTELTIEVEPPRGRQASESFEHTVQQFVNTHSQSGPFFRSDSKVTGEKHQALKRQTRERGDLSRQH